MFNFEEIRIQISYLRTVEKLLNVENIRKNIITILDQIHQVSGLRVYSDNSLMKYDALENDKKVFVYYHAYLIYQFLKQRYNHGVRESDFLRAHLEHLTLSIPEEFYSVIQTGDVVEVYDNDLRPIFQNDQFFKISSYDLLTSLTSELSELFIRDEKTFLQVVRHISTVKGVEKWQVDVHQLTERLHNHRRIFELTPGYIAPVFGANGQRFGWVSTIRARLVGSEFDGTNIRPLK